MTQVIGNFNTLQMLRVRETATAELLTQQLPKVNVLTKTLVSGATDISDPEANTDFTSSSQDRVSSTSVPLIEPAHIVSLPKGQMFSFQAGGQLWKVRMPLPKPSTDDAMSPPMPDNVSPVPDIGLIIVGDEILSGKRADKHLSKTIELLGERGLSLSWARYVGDDRRQITAALRDAFAQPGIVFSCGGIGATPDDHTRACGAPSRACWPVTGARKACCNSKRPCTR
mgnify:CR=1 FL=1